MNSGGLTSSPCSLASVPEDSEGILYLDGNQVHIDVGMQWTMRCGDPSELVPRFPHTSPGRYSWQSFSGCNLQNR